MRGGYLRGLGERALEEGQKGVTAWPLFAMVAVALTAFVVFSVCDKKLRMASTKGQMATIRFGQGNAISVNDKSQGNALKKVSAGKLVPVVTATSAEYTQTQKSGSKNALFDISLLEEDLSNAVKVVKKESTEKRKTLRRSASGRTEFEPELSVDGSDEDEEELEEAPGSKMKEALRRLSELSRKSGISLGLSEAGDKEKQNEKKALKQQLKKKKRVQRKETEVSIPPPPSPALSESVPPPPVISELEVETVVSESEVSALAEEVREKGKKKGARPAKKYIMDVSERERPESIFRPSKQYIEEHQKKGQEGATKHSRTTAASTAKLSEIM